MKPKRTALWVALLVVAAVVGFAARAFATSGDSTSGPTRTITVSGTATLSTTPDEAVIDLGVRSEAVQSTAAIQDNAAKMRSVLEAVTGQGVQKKDIRTLRISLGQQTLDRGQPTERTVFVVQNAVEVTISDLATVGRVIDAAVKAGTEQVRDIRFQVGNPDRVRADALRSAVQTARMKADAMAGAAGAHVSGVISIREQGAPPTPAYQQHFDLGAFPAATPVVPPHDVQTKVSVTVVWSLG